MAELSGMQEQFPMHKKTAGLPFWTLAKPAVRSTERHGRLLLLQSLHFRHPWRSDGASQIPPAHHLKPQAGRLSGNHCPQ
jgi:hypothetical protein